MNVEKAMGQQLKRFFEQLQEEHGMIERMRVSMQCSIPSALAEEYPDSPENLEKFKAAYKSVLGKDVSPVKL
jgi:hypothetical protein